MSRVKGERMQFSSLSEWRRAIGYTQVQAARILGVSQGRYSRWENSEAPRRHTAKRVSERTGVPIANVLRLV